MPEDRTIGQLVSDVSTDLSELIRYEMALAKAEIRADLRRGAVGGGMFGAAGYLLLLMSITLVITAAYGLVAAGLAAWLSFLIVSGVLLLLALLLALVGVLNLRRITPPERTIRSTKLTIAAVRGTRNGADAS